MPQYEFGKSNLESTDTSSTKQELVRRRPRQVRESTNDFRQGYWLGRGNPSGRMFNGNRLLAIPMMGAGIIRRESVV
jgi:hypothetical protein